MLTASFWGKKITVGLLSLGKMILIHFIFLYKYFSSILKIFDRLDVAHASECR